MMIESHENGEHDDCHRPEHPPAHFRERRQGHRDSETMDWIYDDYDALMADLADIAHGDF